ncbi:hypothetical protein NE237_028174 [Protea cynaroides]|uniref:Uncharacterized protein n=1 Tax=Protea cynaroides TaxID=273540 RepID=A0A9Q0GSR6_9MAGN|nr:hypothetical protein NE237_028174 [Protea cynaroides]
MDDSSLHKKVQGKVAIVTRGASGIGEATAHLFADHGTLMVVIADIQDEQGQQVATSIGINRCTYVPCDVTDEDQVNNDGILNNDQKILELDPFALDRLFAVNVRGMAACVKHAGRAMVDSGVRGSIICTASAVASIGTRRHTDYIMSKHAVLGLIRSASLQLGMYGIRMNCVSPALVATPMTCKAYGMDMESVGKVSSSHISLEGMVLKVDHVAEAVLFLASDASASFTGHDLAVDGGFLASKALF